MLIALPVAAVIVVLLKHLRENYERSSFYAPSSTLLIQEGNIEQLHVETENTKLDLEVKTARYRYPESFRSEIISRPIHYMRQLQLDIEPQLDARISDFSGPVGGM